jgi:hypothetical protein
MFNIENLNDNYFTELNPEEILQIKEMSVEDKVTCFKYFLDSEIITNVSVISNIFLLINGISNIDDDTIDDERIFFKSLEEYVDIKLQIRYEIDKFNIRLLEYYFGIIEGLEVVLDELKTHIPNTHFNIMPLVTPQLISRLMTKYLTKLSAERVKPHFNANELYNKIHNSDSLVNGFLMTLSEEI